MRYIGSAILAMVLPGIVQAKPIAFIFEGKVPGYSYSFGGHFDSFKLTTFGDTANREQYVTPTFVSTFLLNDDAILELNGLGARRFSEMVGSGKVEISNANTVGPENDGYSFLFYHPSWWFQFEDPLGYWDWNSSRGPFNTYAYVFYKYSTLIGGELDYFAFPMTVRMVVPEPISLLLVVSSIVPLTLRHSR